MPLPSASHLLEFERRLHGRTVLHLLGQPAVAGAGRVVLLHAGADIHRQRLLVLQHVCEASKVEHRTGGKVYESKKKKKT